MGLQFIFGSSISLKSETVYRQILEEAGENREGLWQIVVPEQSTLIVQKNVLRLTEQLGLMQVDVVSFKRLACRIMEDVHETIPGILDDTGKSMLLRKIAGEVADSLELYRGNLSRKGFIEQLKSMMSEFLQYRVMPEQLCAIADALTEQPLLQHKIRDLGRIYDQFRQEKSGNVITLEELLPRLEPYIPNSGYVTRSVFVLDGFTGFTPVQYALLELLLEYSAGVRIILNMDPRENPYQITGEQELFYMSKQVVAKMTALRDGLTKKAGRESRSTVIEPELKVYEIRPAAEPLIFLEKYLFRYPVQVYPYPTDAIRLHRARNPEEEVQFVLCQVLACIREGYRYRDIAVICSDMETYIPMIEKWFGRAQLPVFVDRKRNLTANPLIELISGVLEAIEKEYAYEPMFRLLRNPLTGIPRRAIDYLENYVKALGIYGEKWKQQWIYSYRGMPKSEFSWSSTDGADTLFTDGTEAEDDPAQAHLSSLNALRSYIMEWLEPLKHAFSDGVSVKEGTILLYQLLQQMEAERQLSVLADRFEADGELQLAKEYSQCFAKVTELLEELVDLMGDEVLALSAYREVLEAGFENLQVGLIPPAIDRLVIGDLQRTRLDGIDVLFLLGCNDAFIPSAGEKHGLLSDLDREFLKKTEIELAPTGREEGFQEKYYLYLMLTKPARRLYLVWSNVSSEGKTMRPCYLVNLIRKHFPQAKETGQDSLSPKERIWQSQESLHILMEGLRDYQKGSTEDWWRDLYSWYHRRERESIYLEHVLGGLFAAYSEEHLSPAVSARIFGSRPLNSVTRLEAFSSCAYAHFLTYGLGLGERQEYQLDAIDYGNIFHASIEKFFQILKEQGLRWQDISEEQRLSCVQESVGAVTEDYGNTILKSSARYRYLVGRLERMTDKTIWALERQLQNGSFTPEGSEVDFSAETNTPGMALEVSPGVTMKLHGRIDRVDLVEKEGEVYVKIVDYKSGSTVLDLTKLYYGLQLQLVLYLSAAMELTKQSHPGKEVVPAGVYYYNIKNPIVDKPGIPEEEEGFQEAVEDAVLEELRMNGLTNSDSQIANLVDHTEGKKSAVVKNLTRDSAGVPTASSLTAATEDMYRLCGYSKKKAADLCREMLSGEIPVNPYEYKDKTGCDYCAYQGICGFDTGIPGYRYRRLKPLSSDEVMALIQEEVSKKER